MADGGSQAQATLIPLHVGLRRPETQAPPVLGGGSAGPPSPSPLTEEALDWAGRGLTPRWIEMESSDCAAALQPNIFHNRGADELSRFFEGAQLRGEVALLLSTIGDAEDERNRSPFGGADASVLLPGLSGIISGRRMPQGVQPALAQDLGPAERDLGLRMLNRVPDAPWWSLSLSGTTFQTAGEDPEYSEPGGSLQPILVDGLGKPVVAVWVSDSGDRRWYVVPEDSSWEVLLDWLVTHALAEHVPDALRRVRSPLALDSALQSIGEAQARRDLEAAEAEYERERQRLLAELAQAEADAQPVRDGLLYGTADTLEDAVAAVLSAAGLDVVKLDEELGDTASADLLVSHDGRRRLVEVKSASGAARENLVTVLYRHLETWPQLRPELPVHGVALIVNHQHRRDPLDRSEQVYERTEFVQSLRVPVLSTRALFDWWRASDWGAIQHALFTDPQPSAPQPPHPDRPA